MRIAFFGTPEIAVIVLEELKQSGILPDLIVTNPDAKIGRKQILTPPPVALFAEREHIALIQPESVRDPKTLPEIVSQKWDLFVVVAYGKIIPQSLLDIPKHGTINVHPSLLPKLRGASPIRSAILNDMRETGVSIMLLDHKMDHGPILAQAKTDIAVGQWPQDGQLLDEAMAHQGGAMLADLIPRYLAGEITPQAQNHDEATFCTKISKDMSALHIDPLNLPVGDEAYQNLLKIRAFSGWPETFFIHEGKRIKIKSASLDATGKLNIARIVPEGKNEMDFQQYFG